MYPRPSNLKSGVQQFKMCISWHLPPSMKYVELCNALSLYPSVLVRIQLIHVHCFKFMVFPSFYRPKNIQGSTFDASVGRKELDMEVRLGRMTDP